MTDLHFDEVRDRRKLKLATAVEIHALLEHERSCAVCKLSDVATRDLHHAIIGTSPDRFAAIAAATMKSLEPAASNVSPFRRRATAVMLIAAALLIAALAAAATVLSRSHPVASEPSSIPAAETSLARAPSTPAATESTPTPPVETAPIATSAPVVAKPPVVDAATLFTRANGARRTGDYGAAETAYRELIAQHPQSDEAVTSRAILGRMLVDANKDPAGALALFDQYLQSAVTGDLAEVSRWGRAVCLQRLGRTRDERKAWETLLAQYPDSAHGPEARKRLEAIEKE